jgi:poly(A) polymerase
MKLPSLAEHEIFDTPGLRAVLAAISGAGGEVRMVGGCVRNALLGEAIHDIDIATNLVPSQVVKAAADAKLRSVSTGIEHGTVTIVSDGTGFEVTTLRHDIETDGRKAKVKYTDDWASDAARRDFTLNALYCSGDGEVFDPLEGFADLESRTIRFVGDPDARIREDYLRILRFFRFISQYGRGEADTNGLAACARLKDGLQQLSRERIGQEFCKLLCGARASEVAKLMNEAGVSRTLFEADLRDTLLACVNARAKTLGVVPDYTTLLNAALPLSADKLSTLLRLSNNQTRSLNELQSATAPTPALRDIERKVVLYQTGAQTWSRAVLLAWASLGLGEEDEWRRLLKLPDEWQVPVFPVKGSDVVAAGFEAGPQVGKVLKSLEDWWMAGGFLADRDELLSRISSQRSDCF